MASYASSKAISGIKKVAKLARLAIVAGIEVKPTWPDAAAPNQAIPTANKAKTKLIASIQRLRKPSLNSLRAIFQICFIAELLPHLTRLLVSYNSCTDLLRLRPAPRYPAAVAAAVAAPWPAYWLVLQTAHANAHAEYESLALQVRPTVLC